MGARWRGALRDHEAGRAPSAADRSEVHRAAEHRAAVRNFIKPSLDLRVLHDRMAFPSDVAVAVDLAARIVEIHVVADDRRRRIARVLKVRNAPHSGEVGPLRARETGKDDVPSENIVMRGMLWAAAGLIPEIDDPCPAGIAEIDHVSFEDIVEAGAVLKRKGTRIARADRTPCGRTDDIPGDRHVVRTL